MITGKLHYQNIPQSSLCVIWNIDIWSSGKDIREKLLLNLDGEDPIAIFNNWHCINTPIF